MPANRLSIKSATWMVALISAIMAVFAPTPAQAAQGWWHVSVGARPSVLPANGPGQLIVSVENLGDGPVDALGSPVRVADVVPSGLKVLSVSGALRVANNELTEPVSCAVESGVPACEITEELWPFQGEIEMRVQVESQGAHSGEEQVASVSGGGLPEVSAPRSITVGESTPFGLQEYGLVNEDEGGAVDTQAGSHPFQQTTTVLLNQAADAGNPGNPAQPSPFPAQLPKDLNFKWPAGLIGNINAVPRCTMQQFVADVEEPVLEIKENNCPANTAVGVAMVEINDPHLANVISFPVPLFNLEPAPGEPARFGFYVTEGAAPVTIDTKLRSGGDYGVTVLSFNITQEIAFLSADVTVWGVPGDPSHADQRGWECLWDSRSGVGCSSPVHETHPRPFLSTPTSCAGQTASLVEGDSWIQGAPNEVLTRASLPPLTGCSRL